MKPYLPGILALCFISFVSPQAQLDDGKTYHSRYEVGDIPGIEDFLKPDETEMRYIRRDSLHQKADTGYLKFSIKNGTDDFRNNRARVFGRMPGDVNHFHKDDSLDSHYISPFCNCVLNKDTLNIITEESFFGGEGLFVRVYKDSFRSNIAAWVESGTGNIYRSNSSDTFDSELEVPARFQYLRLSEKPAFKPGQILNGYFTITSKDYWIKTNGESGGEVQKQADTNRVFFRCRTMSMPER
jgi:hypothetical protein